MESGCRRRWHLFAVAWGSFLARGAQRCRVRTPTQLATKSSKETDTLLSLQKTGRVGKFEDKAPAKPDVSIWLADNDLVGLATGKVRSHSAISALGIDTSRRLTLQVEANALTRRSSTPRNSSRRRYVTSRSSRSGDRKSSGCFESSISDVSILLQRIRVRGNIDKALNVEKCVCFTRAFRGPPSRS